MLDLWNWHFAGGTRDMLQSLGSKAIVSVCLADAPADATIDTISEEQRLLPQPEGPVGNLATLTMIYELGYRGPVTLAPHPKCVSGKTRDAIVQHCGNILEEMWRSMGLSRPQKVTSAAAAVADSPE
jgi:hypothetical protein